MVGREYLGLLFFLIFSVFLAVFLYLLSYFFVTKSADLEKVTSYECGFDPFQDSRSEFEVKFYLVGILFIIFDLEVSFLFPWCVCIGYFSYFEFFVTFLFLLVLTVGFVYEWGSGALDWLILN